MNTGFLVLERQPRKVIDFSVSKIIHFVSKNSKLRIKNGLGKNQNVKFEGPN
jgi:hypothetical protein